MLNTVACERFAVLEEPDRDEHERAKMSARFPTLFHDGGSILRPLARPDRRLSVLALGDAWLGLVDLDLAAFLVDVDVLVVVAALLGSPAALFAGRHET